MYVVLENAAVVGELGVAAGLGSAGGGESQRVERGRLSWNAALGWVFLPCAVLLARGHSPWAMAVTMVAAVPAAVCLRQEFPALRENERRETRHLLPVSEWECRRCAPADSMRCWVRCACRARWRWQSRTKWQQRACCW